MWDLNSELSYQSLIINLYIQSFHIQMVPETILFLRSLQILTLFRFFLSSQNSTVSYSLINEIEGYLVFIFFIHFLESSRCYKTLFDFVINSQLVLLPNEFTICDLIFKMSNCKKSSLLLEDCEVCLATLNHDDCDLTNLLHNGSAAHGITSICLIAIRLRKRKSISQPIRPLSEHN